MASPPPPCPPPLTIIFILLLHSILLSTARDTITPTQPLADGQTLISSGTAFELGFFSPGNSTTRYVGIWYKTIPTQQVVWVANRENPITTTTAVLHLDAAGGLSIQDHTDHRLWSAAASSSTAKDPILQLLDSGNLVLTDGRTLLWQSFDFPTDTLLPGMKIGRDFRINHQWRITSWKSASDPSPGAYSYEMDTDGVPEMCLMKGMVTLWRTGPWSSNGWNGLPTMAAVGILSFEYVSNKEEVYYEYGLNNKSIVSPMSVDHNGLLQRLVWENGSWLSYWKFPMEPCDAYNRCGSYGVCRSWPATDCSCLQGFEPRSPELWKLRYWSSGCGRRTALNCTGGDGFLKVSVLKLPDASNASTVGGVGVDECRARCLMNCSCVAFAVVGGGNGCISWVGDLKDMRVFTTGGDDLYLRLAASEIEGDFHGRKKLAVIVIVTTVAAGGLMICVCLCITRKKCNKGVENIHHHFEAAKGKDLEMPLLSFSIISTATKNFSLDNKLGEGGFGPVYKGMLFDVQVAVKRLSRSSTQGLEEFKSEIQLLAKLQHTNLVKILGSCIKAEEKIVVYEYMENGSLDKHLFDPNKGAMLDWPKRVHIIKGITQGLLYLHKYSRLRVIHRDLKASNILLDADMNPKISDFGLARIFSLDKSQINTNRVVGTYGYMSPEYAMEGLFSVKSDVFSFGVLLLEILSGKKIFSHCNLGSAQNLLGYTWELWTQGKEVELMDISLGETCPTPELSRYVKVALLCVQELAIDRPTITDVSDMFSNQSAILPAPKQSAFIKGRCSTSRDANLDMALPCSNNYFSLSLIDGR